MTLTTISTTVLYCDDNNNSNNTTYIFYKSLVTGKISVVDTQQEVKVI